MEIKTISETLSVGPQLQLSEVEEIASAGFKSIMVNRPDAEGDDQPTFAEIAAAAERHGMTAAHVPVSSGKITDADVEGFSKAMGDLPEPVFGFCRTGTRTTTLWALSHATETPLPELLATAKLAGYDLSGAATRIANGGKVPTDVPTETHQIVVVGGGAAGIAAAASMLARSHDLDIAIIVPPSSTIISRAGHWLGPEYLHPSRQKSVWQT